MYDFPNDVWAVAAKVERFADHLDTDPGLTDRELAKHKMASAALLTAAEAYAASLAAWEGPILW